jgi:hypothetical protein
MWKTQQQADTFNRCLDGAKQTGFNGCITYANKADADKACATLVPTIDEAYELTAHQGKVYAEVNQEYMSEPRLRVTGFLEAIIDTNPVSAEFEAEGEDGEQYQIHFESGKWVLLQRPYNFTEVA